MIDREKMIEVIRKYNLDTVDDLPEGWRSTELADRLIEAGFGKIRKSDQEWLDERGYIPSSEPFGPSVKP